ncbi:hypothetical protein MSL71_23260 [Desulfoluna butyratoxydans]|uniref:Uncharacterized protein n=1 Tax=Desulfoluna butyratoxydans TaxID=231438 RepID=A0A4U8YMB9_9BACT|nr:hypothetical protein MSL71_23260 [Desulfoluna butyratoxydans]
MESNDPKRQTTSLIFRGHVEKVVTITPSQVRLIGKEGQELTAKVRIVPSKEYPFKLLSANPMNPKLFTVDVKEVAGKAGREYELTVKNVTSKSGRYSSTIDIDTDSEIRPQMRIQVTLYIRKKA